MLQTEKQLGSTRQQHWRAIQEEHLDNVGAVILGSFEITAEEKTYVVGLEEKYDMLRHVLFLHVLKVEHGAAWDR